jgi:hypothetical protein
MAGLPAKWTSADIIGKLSEWLYLVQVPSTVFCLHHVA